MFFLKLYSKKLNIITKVTYIYFDFVIKYLKNNLYFNYYILLTHK